MADIGKAYVQIVPSGQGVEESLRKLLGDPSEKTGKESGSKAGSALVAGLKKALAGAAIGKTIKDIFMAGADLEQNLGGTEAVFGQFAQNIQDKAKQAYDNMGLSASEYMATANKMGSLFQGSGLDQVRAMELSTEAMQRAADVASVMGIDGKAALESIAGAAKGNFTMMDNLGVAMNATTLEAYALEKGLNFKWNVASNAEKAELAMQMFFDRTSQYAGNFKREASETFSGAFDSLKASWKDVQGALSTGYNLDGALKGLTTSLVAFAKNTVRLGTNIVTALGRGLLQGVPYIMQRGTEILNSFGDSISTAFPTIIARGGELLLKFVDGITSNLPGLINAATNAINVVVNGLVAGIPVILSTGKDLVVKLASGLLQAAPNVMNAIGSILQNLIMAIIRNFPKILQQGIEILGKLVQGVLIGIPRLLATVPKIFSKMSEKFQQANWGQIGSDLIAGIKNGVLNAVSSLAQAAAQAVRDAVNAAKDEAEIGSPSKVMAREVGHWLPLGMAVGFEDAMPEAGRMMNASIDGAIMSAQRGVMNMSAPVSPLTASDLNNAMSGMQMPAPVVKIVGDTSRIFKVVNDTNQVRTRATNYNALAMG